MNIYFDDAVTLDTIVDGKEKTLRDLVNENKSVAKSYVFDNFRDHLLPDEETLKACGIKRIVHEKTISQVAFDREIVKDNKIYPKETAKLANILKDLNTIERTADKFVDE